jgi:hypothetical protein
MNYVIAEAGSKCWYNDKGQLHRDDGPAAELRSGNKYWCINGKFHRLDGPAIERCDLHQEWWIDGTKIDCNDNDEFLRIVKMKELL